VGFLSAATTLSCGGWSVAWWLWDVGVRGGRFGPTTLLMVMRSYCGGEVLRC
jgi:hypothetical protein